jgi:hypothetical protein
MAQEKCPICKKAAPVHLAVVPYVKKDGTVIGEYGVCDPCHVQQYKEKYGYTPAEAPSKAPPDDPLAGEY